MLRRRRLLGTGLLCCALACAEDEDTAIATPRGFALASEATAPLPIETWDIDDGCEQRVVSNLPGASLRVTTERCVYAPAELENGVDIAYEVRVERPLRAVTPHTGTDTVLVPWPKPPGAFPCIGPTDASNLSIAYWIAGEADGWGKPRLFVACPMCDVGLCSRQRAPPTDVESGTYARIWRSWTGRQFFGSSCTDEQPAEPFPPGDYVLTLRADGSFVPDNASAPELFHLETTRRITITAGDATTPFAAHLDQEPPPDAQVTPSGLRSVILRPGVGRVHPRPDHRVRMRYAGRTAGGAQLDRSFGGNTRILPVADLFPGWSEAVQLMVVGEYRRFWLPAALNTPVPHGGSPLHLSRRDDLVLDVELLSIYRAPVPAKSPRQCCVVPHSARRTASGLAYKVLAAGSGSRRPRANDTVVIEYSGWTSRRSRFTSTDPHGPRTARPSELIRGWAEGVQRMVEGERTRFWIPQALAYDGQDGQPTGTLMIEVHLLEVIVADQSRAGYR